MDVSSYKSKNYARVDEIAAARKCAWALI